ncbi:MAG: redox-sensing transcriptional repressor Rex [Chloroflexota bacterium]
MKTLKKTELKAIPEPTLRRMTHYLHLLVKLQERGDIEVASTYIAQELMLDSTQVRKDIQFTGIVGKPKTGFNIPRLIEAIKSSLSWHTCEDAFLVGAGNLGAAMLGYDFSQFGINFVAAFDNSPEKIGSRIHGVEVLDINRLIVLGKLMKVKVGVLTVPGPIAQQTADLMIEAGIKAIWNFSAQRLKVPKDVIVENAQFSQSLAVLTRKLAMMKKSMEAY